MIQDQLTIQTLQKLGLTYYEAKVYVALMSTGVTNPTTIQRNPEFPVQKFMEY